MLFSLFLKYLMQIQCNFLNQQTFPRIRILIIGLKFLLNHDIAKLNPRKFPEVAHHVFAVYYDTCTYQMCRRLNYSANTSKLTVTPIGIHFSRCAIVTFYGNYVHGMSILVVKVHVNSVLILVYLVYMHHETQYSAFSINSRYANLTYKI